MTVLGPYALLSFGGAVKNQWTRTTFLVLLFSNQLYLTCFRFSKKKLKNYTHNLRQ
jgi:hypothetical protein